MLNRGIIIILTVSILVHLAVFLGAAFHPSRVMTPDSYDYRLLADSVVASGHFSRTVGEPEIYRVPGYPLFLAAVRAFFGPSPIPPIVLQCVLDAALCLLVFHFLRHVRFGDPAPGMRAHTAEIGFRVDPALIAAAWQAVAVVSAVYACRLLSDSLFAVLLFVGLAWVVRLAGLSSSVKEASWRQLTEALGAGLFLGFLGLWRVVLLPFSFLLPLVLLRRRRPRAAGMLLLGLLLVPGGWTVRNGIRAGYWGVSSVSALNLYRYEAAALEASRTGRTFGQQQALFDARLYESESQADQARFAFREGLRICSRAPLRMVAIHTRADLGALLPAAGELLRTFGVDVGGRGTLGVLRDRGLLAATRHYFNGNLPAALFGGLCAAILLLKYAAACTGILTGLRRGVGDAHWLLLAALAYFLFIPGPAAHPRFRVPAEPILSVYAGIGVWWWMVWIAARHDRRQRMGHENDG